MQRLEISLEHEPLITRRFPKMVEIGNLDVFILTFEEPFNGYLLNITKSIQKFYKSAKMPNMSNSSSLVTMICLHQYIVTLFTKQNTKIKNQWRKCFRKSSHDKWLLPQTNSNMWEIVRK